MPFLPAISLAVVAMGALNAEEKYTAPGLASSMFNLVAIAGGVAVWLWGPSPARGGDDLGGADAGGRRRAAGDPGAVAVADWGFARACSPISRLRDPGTRRIATLMAPATLGVAAVQINVVVNSSFASLISDGALSWLSYAFRLMQLPIGVFGVAVGTTALTHLSRDAAGAGLGPHARDLAARPAHGAVPDRAVDGRAGAAGRADHPPHLRARAVLAARDDRDGARAVGLRDRAGRVRGDQGRRAGVLRARPHARAADRQRLGGRREPDLEHR